MKPKAPKIDTKPEAPKIDPASSASPRPRRLVSLHKDMVIAASALASADELLVQADIKLTHHGRAKDFAIRIDSIRSRVAALRDDLLTLVKTYEPKHTQPSTFTSCGYDSDVFTCASCAGTFIMGSGGYVSGYGWLCDDCWSEPEAS